MAVAELIDVDSGAAPVSARRFYRPELDVLRLVAFSLVFMAHLLPRTTGAYQGHLPNTWARVAVAAVDAANFGLPLFFFLSAFLITELLFREQDKSGTVSIKDFAIRRTLRIWPLYLVGLGIGTAYLFLMKSHGGEPGSALMLVMYTVMLGNWYFAAGGRQWPSNPVTPLWSISVEEQFYAIWPVLIKIGGRGSAIIASLFMLAVAVGVEGYLGAKGADPDVVVWTNTFVQFEFFACGALFALYLGQREIVLSPLQRGTAILLTVTCWFAATLIFNIKSIGFGISGAALIFGYALCVIGVAALLLAIWGSDGWPPLMVYLGRISYGLYVFHLLALQLADHLVFSLLHVTKPLIAIPAKGAVALLLTIALAAASYRFLETPFLKLKERFAVVLSRPV